MAIPDNIGAVDVGTNTISGSISADFTEPIPQDDADSFEFTVPAGLVVTNVELVITDYTATDGARAWVRTFSGGTATRFIDSDTTFTNLITAGSGVLAEGNHDLQVAGLEGGEPPDFTGTVSLTWKFTLNVVTEGVPVERATWGRIKNLYGVGSN